MFTIRQAMQADTDIAYQLFLEAKQEQRLDHWISGSKDAFARDLLGDNPPVAFYLAFDTDRPDVPLGMVTCTRVYSLYSNRYNIYMRCLYVVPSARCSGLARFIMGFAARLALAEDSTLSWEVQGNNIHAQAFYEKIGCAIDPDGLIYYDAAGQELDRLVGYCLQEI